MDTFTGFIQSTGIEAEGVHQVVQRADSIDLATWELEARCRAFNTESELIGSPHMHYLLRVELVVEE
jgi:hypothetical protein